MEYYQLYQLLENQTDRKSLKQLLDSVYCLRNRIIEDKKALKYCQQLSAFILKALKEPDYILSDSGAYQYDVLACQCHSSLMARHNQQVQEVDEAARQFIYALLRNELDERLRENIDTIIQTALLDSDGRPIIKLDLLRDIFALVHRSVTRLQFLPLPDIETEAKEAYVSLRNIVLQCPRVLPEQFTIRTMTRFDMGNEDQPLRNSLKIVITKIKGEAHDIAFKYRQKTFPYIKHEGLVSASMVRGHGMRVKLLLTTPLPTDKEKKVKVSVISVDISYLKLRFKNTKYDILHRMVEPIINVIASKMVGKLIANNIRQWMSVADERLNSIDTLSNTLCRYKLAENYKEPRMNENT
ncbi:hypothetical protein BDF22DRAFT_440896 [Syncephalis plumigaleata]|nr:hypothetical protein BDF22DRAFT_440896 [Syncephalis plumigaleata]